MINKILAGTIRHVPFILAGVVLFAVLFIGKCVYDRNSKTRVELGKNQTDAALASGKDAVSTIAETHSDEIATDKITSENEKAIRNAKGSNEVVSSPANDAGLASLCRRAAYRKRPECMQYADPR